MGSLALFSVFFSCSHLGILPFLEGLKRSNTWTAILANLDQYSLVMIHHGNLHLLEHHTLNFFSSSHKEVQYRSKICGPKCACKTRLRVKHARVCVFDTRMKYAHKAKLISIYELAHCRPIVVISLLVLIAFYCINVYGNGYSAEQRLANPAPCLFQFTGKHVEISSGVFLIKKKT